MHWERAPFDHPSLPLAVAHEGSETAVVEDTTPGFVGLAATHFVELPAVGRNGRTAAMGPLRAFAERVAP